MSPYQIIYVLVMPLVMSFVWGFVIGFVRKLRANPTEAGQDGQQGPAGLGGVPDRHGLPGEQQREVEVFFDGGLRGQPLRELGGLGVLRVAALDGREGPADQGGDQQDGDGGEQAA